MVETIQWLYDKYRALGWDHDPSVREVAKEMAASIEEVAAIVGKYGC